MTSVVDESLPGVLFVIPTLESGGAERACINYINNLHGYRRFLVLLAGRGPLVDEVAPEVRICDLSSEHYRPGRSRLLHYWSPMRQARSLARLAHHNRCATISAFLTEANLVAILAKTFFDRRLRVVANVHDVTTSILASSRKLKNRQRFLLKSLIRLLYARADSVVAVAGGVKSDMVQHFKVPDGKIAVIHNPIDVTRIQVRAVEPVAHPWVGRKDSVLAVAVGRLVKLKGFDFLIQAFAQLPKTLDARLIILGEGVERPRLEQMIGQFGLQERAALLGFQDNPWKYMARADVLVLSSLTEGSPNVIGEAMALGLPVLATDCSAGVSDYVQDGQNGLLVAPGDVKALSEGLQRLLSDGSLRRRLAQGARERATAFDIGKAVQTYEAVLVRVMKG